MLYQLSYDQYNNLIRDGPRIAITPWKGPISVREDDLAQVVAGV